ncbi:MAG: excinuclease ABC subunit UvrA [Patescibacteria group bacterium]|nr:excinuclease ABC subunit UvrA [Patescibacteria group bacterium]
MTIRGARVNNLKNVSCDIPRNKFTVITGLSGSGKSSLAFDTIYAEGQRRYMESLSSYARQFLEMQDKPDVDEIKGLSPTVAINQRTSSQNPRSTVGTVTEVYDYLRLLFAKAGTPYCPKCKVAMKSQTTDEITDKIFKVIGSLNDVEEIMLIAPVIKDERGEHKSLIKELANANYKMVRYDNDLISIVEALDKKVDRNKKHTIEIVVEFLTTSYLTDNTEAKKELKKLVEKTLDLGNGSVVLYNSDKDENKLLSLNLTCPKCHLSIADIEPRFFSFNSPHGACPECTGLGVVQKIEPDLIIPNKRLTIEQGAIKPLSRIAGNQTWYNRLLVIVAKTHKFRVDVPVSKLTKKAMKVLLYGTGEKDYELGGKTVKFDGIIPHLEHRYNETDSDYIRKEVESYMRTFTCEKCKGKRLKNEALSVLFLDKNIAELVTMSLGDLNKFFADLSKTKKNLLTSLDETKKQVATHITREIATRTANLLEAGVGYLSLDRSITTLSGGETQRVRLATQLGSGLSDVIYILDEPSIGLHEKDNLKLLKTLRKLQERRNTVVVVEHDASTIEEADCVIDMGPGAGIYGGEIVASGTSAEIKKNAKSLTGKYLTGKEKIKVKKICRKGSGKNISITGATEFNLKKIDTKIPLGKFVCVTGVSGSGKSTLILEILAKALSKKFYGSKDLPGKHKEIKGVNNIDKIISVDQSPIGRTPRSNPATYTGVFTPIRDLFTEVPEAKMRGYDAGKFSFNVKDGGRCETCAGEGYVQIEMHFLPDVYVECKECRSKRYRSEVLEIHYKGKTIADVLEMTVEEARDFFRHHSLIHEKLSILKDVGLGYVHLGQPATTLSGGEAQRVKLATELSRRDTGKTLYILDEPTTGLHFDDIKRLLEVLDRLVDKGNTVLVIEHNLDVIKTADWVIDMGPEGGVQGGELVAEGTPKDVAKIKKSYTGQYLKKLLR